jgi:hypothetical protein
MTLTPRQAIAYLELAEQLARIDRANDLTIANIGAQGDKAAVEKALASILGRA